MSAHEPVLVAEVMAATSPLAGAVAVDGTYGRGGYARAALEAGVAELWALDRDPDAVAHARTAAAAEPRLHPLLARFGAMDAVLAGQGVRRVDAIMLDIGVSSPQLDDAARGFSFQADGPLDMRMEHDGPSAADVVNGSDEDELARIIKELGEEPRARRVARAIVAARPLSSTGALAAVIRRALGWNAGMPRDPATRTFQALRIHVNNELDELARGLAAAERVLAPGGRLAVVTFHSLEDRIVKTFLRARGGAMPGGSRHLPFATAGPAPSFEPPLKAVRAGAAELARNPRARSATLRAARRTAAPAWETPQ